MNPEIKNISSKKLGGKSLTMSFAKDRTVELWQSFMPQRRLISNTVSTYLYSIQVFNRVPDFKSFDPDETFQKWAAIEVTSFDDLPERMQTLKLHAGLYAVFLYKGKASDAEPFYRHIFQEWLPASGYELDDRPHLAIMGEKYKNNDDNSEEEICIPVKIKQS